MIPFLEHARLRTPLLAGMLIAGCLIPGGLGAQTDAGDPAAEVPAQVIAGLVLDATTGEAIPAMDVVVRNVRQEILGRTISGDDGRFWVSVPDPGLYRLAVSGLGYDSTGVAEVAVTRGQNLYVELRVEPRAIGLGGITVTAPRTVPWLLASGFYDRQRRGFGHFIEPEDLDRAPGSIPTQMLRRVPGVTVDQAGQVLVRGGPGSFNLMCAPEIVVDGMPLRLGPDETIDDLLPLNWIDGIEIYKGAASVPSRWRGNSACGVILIWTKH